MKSLPTPQIIANVSTHRLVPSPMLSLCPTVSDAVHRTSFHRRGETAGQAVRPTIVIARQLIAIRRPGSTAPRLGSMNRGTAIVPARLAGQGIAAFRKPDPARAPAGWTTCQPPALKCGCTRINPT